MHVFFSNKRPFKDTIIVIKFLHIKSPSLPSENKYTIHLIFLMCSYFSSTHKSCRIKQLLSFRKSTTYFFQIECTFHLFLLCKIGDIVCNSRNCCKTITVSLKSIFSMKNSLIWLNHLHYALEYGDCE